jgi:hypothetical protein
LSTSKRLRIVFLIICFFIVLPLITSGQAVAATYYISPNGSNQNSGTASCSNAWLTFSYAQSRMSAGDTLYLCDGTYTTSNSGMLVAKKSGQSGKYITFAALNEGSAIIDCRNTCNDHAIHSNNYDWLKFIGMRAKNADGGHSVVKVGPGSNNVILQRITAHDTENGNNTHVISVEGNTVLLEDCAGWGVGRNMLLIYEPATNVTVRRFFAQLKRHDGTGGGMACTQIYGAKNTIMENFICTVNDNFSSPNYGQTNGISIWDNNQNSTDNNAVYGSIVYDIAKVDRWGRSKDFNVTSKSDQISGNSFTDCVSIGDNYGGNEYSLKFGLGDSDLEVTNCTFIGAEKDGIQVESPYSISATDNLTVQNTIVMNASSCGYNEVDPPNSFTHSYNNYYNNGSHMCNESQSATEKNKNPNFDTATYGYGAYLMRPSALHGLGKNGVDIGAEVLYRYKNGNLTNVPLWPWPMENRIYSELGVSVTYERNGGLWKTLDNVYNTSVSQLPERPTGLHIIKD